MNNYLYLFILVMLSVTALAFITIVIMALLKPNKELHQQQKESLQRR